jgi:gas vesicle protein
MIDALNTATTGLLKAEKRANELATSIVQSASSSINQNAENSAYAPQAQKQSALSSNSSPELINQIVELKATQRQFDANASVFSSVDESQDLLMGTLFDEKT